MTAALSRVLTSRPAKPLAALARELRRIRQLRQSDRAAQRSHASLPLQAGGSFSAALSEAYLIEHRIATYLDAAINEAIDTVADGESEEEIRASMEDADLLLQHISRRLESDAASAGPSVAPLGTRTGGASSDGGGGPDEEDGPHLPLWQRLPLRAPRPGEAHEKDMKERDAMAAEMGAWRTEHYGPDALALCTSRYQPRTTHGTPPL